jgi:hypothetical protein
MYRAFRAAAYDPPEDLILRLEPGLDPDTMRRLARGLRIVRSLRRIEQWILRLLVGGTVVLLASGVLVLAGVTNVAAAVITVTAAAWGFAVVAFAAWLVVGLAGHRDLKAVYGFWRAMQGSSLARDLA